MKNNVFTLAAGINKTRTVVLLILLLATLSMATYGQYRPDGGAFVCENGTNRYTRALYGSHTDWRLETSDRPVFAVVKKGHHRNISFTVDDRPMDALDHCKAYYKNGMRSYALKDTGWGDA